MTVTTSKGIARHSVLKPGDNHLTDAAGVPFTADNRDRHGSENAPTGVDATPKRFSGAGVDIDSTDMPEDGVIAVHDSDEELLDAERETPIADDTRPVR